MPNRVRMDPIFTENADGTVTARYEGLGVSATGGTQQDAIQALLVAYREAKQAPDFARRRDELMKAEALPEGWVRSTISMEEMDAQMMRGDR